MEIQQLKEHIEDNELTEKILENLGCHSIRNRGSYITCGNPDGDNKAAVVVYPDLGVVNYTRKISDKTKNDIFDLAQFYLKENFFKTVKKICEWLDLDYYKDWEENLPPSIKIAREIIAMQKGETYIREDVPLKPISEKILSYYYPYVNDMFKKDNISYKTQQFFEIGYDSETNRITIPIRDELGTLVGVKGRLFKENPEEWENKYLYIEKCCRSKILYGLNLTYPYIKRRKEVIVTESEKGVMQLWNMGYCNGTATGGKKVSNEQIEKLTRLCVPITLCFDKDVKQNELEEIADRFLDGVNVYAIIDSIGLLNEKESPTDNPEKFKRLVKECKIKIK